MESPQEGPAPEATAVEPAAAPTTSSGPESVGDLGLLASGPVASAQISPAEPLSEDLPMSALPDYTSTTIAAQQQWFLAGAAAGTTLRTEAIPGRTYYGFDGVTVTDPFDVFQASGLNAMRVETALSQCTGPTPPFNNSGDVRLRELNFALDFGCIDLQVRTAALAKSRNMKIILTVNFGTDIPAAWTNYSYKQMLQAIDIEVRRQIAPFLEAAIQPDIILLENEGTSGFLFNVILPDGTKYARGSGAVPSVPASQVQQERSGQLPTGLIVSYPQLAGYYKQEILSLCSAMQQAGFQPAATRFGLHSHVQYIDFKQSIVYSKDPDNERSVLDDGIRYNFSGIIPDGILNLRASDVLDIMGFSSYPLPGTPTEPSSPSSQEATFDRLHKTLSLMDQVAQRYGKFGSGPYAGQFVKQGLAVEYASKFAFPDQIPYQQQHTALYFKSLQAYPWVLGALWWEPTYCVSNFEGGRASLYHVLYVGNQSNAAPTATMVTWGSFANTPDA